MVADGSHFCLAGKVGAYPVAFLLLENVSDCHRRRGAIPKALLMQSAKNAVWKTKTPFCDESPKHMTCISKSCTPCRDFHTKDGSGV
jgi:hypothetical protein